MSNEIKSKTEELRDIAKSLGLGLCGTLTRRELLVLITNKLGEEAQKKPVKSVRAVQAVQPIQKYEIGKQIGNTGKEAKTFSVRDKHKQQDYAMKTFRKNKSGDRIIEEVNFQKRCAGLGISPEIIDYSTDEKYIVMEKMDGHLYETLESQQGLLSEKIQKRIVEIFKMLDKARVFHGDANIMNYMYKNGKIYIIDFGFSKEIDDTLVKKLATPAPNLDIMLLGFIIKLKEMGCPKTSYSVLVKYISKEKRTELGLDG